MNFNDICKPEDHEDLGPETNPESLERARAQRDADNAKLPTRIQALHDALKNRTKLQANIWKDRRIYLNGFGRDIKAYFHWDFETQSEPHHPQEDLFTFSTLSVFSNCQTQTHKWRVNRAKQVKHGILMDLKNAGLLESCPENWEDVILC